MGHKIVINGLPEHTFNVFSGGREGGKSLQITLDHGEYLQLSQAQVRELANKLLEEWNL